MIYVNFHYMGNILFNYLPGPEAIAERGYRPLLSLMEKYPQLRSHVYCSSRTGLMLKERFPDVYQRIRKGVDEGRIEIGFNGYEHAAFNCLSPDSTIRQIEKGLEVDLGIWEVAPQGYWPSDCRWDPYVGYVLRERDIGWVFLDWGSVKLSNPGPPFYPDWRDLDPCRPMNVRCPMGVKVPAILWETPNYETFLPDQVEAFFGQLERLNAERDEDGYVSVALDFEALLLLGDRPDVPALREEQERVWEHLLIAENSEVRFTDLPSDLRASSFYPTEGLLLETYEHGIQAFEGARTLKQRLFRMYHDLAGALGTGAQGAAEE